MASSRDLVGDDKRPLPRECTDKACLVVFLAFLAGMAFAVDFGVRQGNPRRLTRGLDYMGRVCGVDANVSFKPWLYWCGNSFSTSSLPLSLNLGAPICVARCPTTTQGVERCPGEPQVTQEVVELTDKWATITRIVQEEVNQGTYPTQERAGVFCFPHIAGLNESLSSELLAQLWGDGATAHSLELYDSVADLERVMALLFFVLLGAFLLSGLDLLLLKWCIRPLLYGCLGLLALALMAAGAAAFLVGSGTSAGLAGHEAQSPVFNALPPDQVELWSIVLGALLTLLGLGLAVAVVCLRETIQTVVGCIEAACECLFDMPSLLMEPVLGAILKLALLAVLCFGFVYLLSTGEVRSNSVTVAGMAVAGVSRSVEYTEEQLHYIVFYGFGCIWLLELCDAFQAFVISYAVVMWYYQEKSDPGGRKESPRWPVSTGAYFAVRYHLGSLALGSFLVASTRVVRLVLAFVAKQSKDTGNKALACVAQACVCCITCFQNFLEFINKNAYIHMAVHSTNFIISAMDSCKFIFAEGSEIALLHGACWLANAAGTVAISGTGGGLTYFLVTSCDRWRASDSPHHVEEPLVVAVVAGLLCFCVSFVFMLVFDQCADTLLYVFLDNKVSDPHSLPKYAPDTLARLVGDRAGYSRLEQDDTDQPPEVEQDSMELLEVEQERREHDVAAA